jgi:hypothetical protein
VQLDKVTNRLATPSCPETYTAAFIAGTEPRDTCDQETGVRGFFSRIFGGTEKPLPPPPAGVEAGQSASGQSDQGKKKKGFFGKIADIFKEDKPSKPPSNQPNSGGDDHPH